MTANEHPATSGQNGTRLLSGDIAKPHAVDQRFLPRRDQRGQLGVESLARRLGGAIIRRFTAAGLLTPGVTRLRTPSPLLLLG